MEVVRTELKKVRDLNSVQEIKDFYKELVVDSMKYMEGIINDSSYNEIMLNLGDLMIAEIDRIIKLYDISDEDYIKINEISNYLDPESILKGDLNYVHQLADKSYEIMDSLDDRLLAIMYKVEKRINTYTQLTLPTITKSMLEDL